MIQNSLIKALHAKDFRLFKELNIIFNDRFNFICGANSSGKTSILRCISMCLNPNYYNDTRFNIDSEFYIDVLYDNTTYSLGLGKGWLSKANNYRMNANGNTWLPPHVKETNGLSVGDCFGNKKLPLLAPLFIGAYRKIDYMEIPGMSKETRTSESINNYTSNNVFYLCNNMMPNVKQWMINRHFIRNESWATKEKTNWEWLTQNMNHIGPKDSNLEFLEIKRDLEPKFKVFGNECYLEELSAGFQAVLSLILSIFEWIEKTNENDFMLAKNAIGTVLIDELDAHLHPEWQLTIRNTLAMIFPKLQFIVTTHSPHLIATAKKGEVIEIVGENGIYNLSPSDRTYSGWTTDQILEDVMQVKSLENQEYKQLIDEAMFALEQNDGISMNQAISKLENITHKSDTIVEVLKIRLAKMKATTSDKT